MATDTFNGKHYCWQHSPVDKYAKRRSWLKRKGKKVRICEPSRAALAIWESQKRAIEQAVKEEAFDG
jgi:hypothetical protein